MDFKLWFIATRPWSFVMTLVSGGLAGVLAFQAGKLDPYLLTITLVGLVAFHAATNMANDYFDVKHGVDKPEAPTAKYRPHPLLFGLVSGRSFLTVTSTLYAIVLAVGLYLTLVRGPLVLALTLLGLGFSVFYTADPLAFKHRGFGEPVVFLVWGPLMVGGTYFVVTGVFALGPVLASVPIGLLVALVLLANNLRDIEYDSGVDVRTVAAKLGLARGLALYKTLLASVYAATLLLVLFRVLAPWSLLTLLTLPQARGLVRTFTERVPEVADPMTAQLTLHYGLLLLLGEVLGALIPLP
jgi:1,4-dihydroxy-2-naphthoate octaprenyltransferase